MTPTTTATGASDEAAATLAGKLTEGRARTLPARGLASTVFSDLRYSAAATFSVVTPELQTGGTLSLI